MIPKHSDCATCTAVCVYRCADASTILVVEDSSITSEVISAILKKDGHTMLVAGSLAEAKILLTHEQVELILLDDHLPDGRGSEWLMTDHPGVPVIMLTADESRHLAVECLSDGLARKFLLKPIRPTTLTTIVGETLQAIRLERKFEVEHIARLAAESANRMKSEFLSLLSHELRTPLTPIFALEQILDDPELLVSEDGKRILHRAIRAAERLSSMTEMALRITRLRDQQLTCTPTPLERIIRESIAFASDTVGEKDLDLTTETHPATLIAWTDPIWLREILRILLDNAIRFTERGVVNVSAWMNGDAVEINVADTGIGIPPDRLSSIFNLFTQADMSSTRRHGGLGLGLTSVKAMVETIGGSISVKSEVGKGSTFIITLPREEPIAIFADKGGGI